MLQVLKSLETSPSIGTPINLPLPRHYPTRDNSIVQEEDPPSQQYSGHNLDH